MLSILWSQIIRTFFVAAVVFAKIDFGLAIAETPKYVPPANTLVDLKYVMCKNSKTVRTIRISQPQKDIDQCMVTYTKAGVDRVVGSGSSRIGCFEILNNIRINLEKSHWQCKDISSSISSSKTYYEPATKTDASRGN